MANFNKKTISLILAKLSIYNVLHVTTEGQMFLSEKDAEESVRTKNMLIEDQNDLIGLVVLSKEMFPTDKVYEIGKDTKVFDKLFDKARIPVAKKDKKNTGRQHEEVMEENVDDVLSIEKALGLHNDVEDTVKNDAVDTVKNDAVDGEDKANKNILNFKK